MACYCRNIGEAVHCLTIWNLGADVFVFVTFFANSGIDTTLVLVMLNFSVSFSYKNICSQKSPHNFDI